MIPGLSALEIAPSGSLSSPTMGTSRGAEGPERVALVRPDGRAGGVAVGAGGRAAPPPEPPLELLGVAGALDGAGLGLRLSIFDALAEDGGNAAALDRALAVRPGALVVGTPGPSDGARAAMDDPAARELLRTGLRARDAAPADAAPDGARPLRIALTHDDGEFAAHLLRESAFDVVVRGEPEEVLPAAMRAKLAATDPVEAWRGVRGVSWRSGEEVVHGAPARRPLEPATPAWELLDLGAYRAPVATSRFARLAALDRLPLHRISTGLATGVAARRAGRRGAATLRTTQACADSCPTCRGSYGAPGPERSVRDVIAEVRDLVTRRGVRELRIVDHAFDGKPARAAEIARGIARIRSAPAYAGLVVRFPHGFRGDGLTPELAGALVALGLRRFDVRVGTASDRLQRLLRRNIRLEKARDGIRAVAEAGGVARLHLELGLPTETVGEAAHTIRWAASTHALELVVENGAQASYGPHFQRDGADEIDDFASLRRRATAAFYAHRRRGPARLWRAGVARALPGRAS